MYNLLISANENDWEGDPFFLELDRFCEHTDPEISKKFTNLDDKTISEIIRLPAVFAYERQCQKDPKFGLIRRVVKRQKKIRIDYDLVPLEKFLTHTELQSSLFDFDITDREMNRTHWAIKNINLVEELNAKNVYVPFAVASDSKAVDISVHNFDVALSFPGEFRATIEKVVTELEDMIGRNSYFYDNNYKAQLARPNLDALLEDIYRNRSKLVVVFLCEKYNEKLWCGLEFRAIKEMIMNKEYKRIMFIKMDDGKVDGVFKIDGYVEGIKHTPRELAGFIKERIELLDS